MYFVEGSNVFSPLLYWGRGRNFSVVSKPRQINHPDAYIPLGISEKICGFFFSIWVNQAFKYNCFEPGGTIKRLYIIDLAISFSTRWFLIVLWRGPSYERGGWRSGLDPGLRLVVALRLWRACLEVGCALSGAALLSNHPDAALTGLTAMAPEEREREKREREIAHVTRPTLALHLFPLRIITFYWFSWSTQIPVTFQPSLMLLVKISKGHSIQDLLPITFPWPLLIIDNVCRWECSEAAARPSFFCAAINKET